MQKEDSENIKIICKFAGDQFLLLSVSIVGLINSSFFMLINVYYI